MKKYLLAIIFLVLNISIWGQSSKPMVFVTISEECPISIAMVDDLKDLHNRFQNEIDFTLVFPMLSSDTTSASNFVSEYDMAGFSIMVKNANKFCKDHELKITPEAMLLSSNNEIIYRGRISNLYSSPGKKNHKVSKNDLKEAISSFLKKLSPHSTWPKAVGCAITYEQE
jgi:hypothetical protein